MKSLFTCKQCGYKGRYGEPRKFSVIGQYAYCEECLKGGDDA